MAFVIFHYVLFHHLNQGSPNLGPRQSSDRPVAGRGPSNEARFEARFLQIRYYWRKKYAQRHSAAPRFRCANEDARKNEGSSNVTRDLSLYYSLKTVVTSITILSPVLHVSVTRVCSNSFAFSRALYLCPLSTSFITCSLLFCTAQMTKFPGILIYAWQVFLVTIVV